MADRIDDLVFAVGSMHAELSEIGKQVVKSAVLLETQGYDVETLKTQMKTALIPILFAKWFVALCAGLSTIGAVLYALTKI